MEHGDCFFFNDTATTEIYTLSLHDALPICCAGLRPRTARPTGPAHLPRTPCALHGVRQLPPCGGLWRRRTATLSAAGGGSDLRRRIGTGGAPHDRADGAGRADRHFTAALRSGERRVG